MDLFTEADEDKSPLDPLEDMGWAMSSVEMVPAVQFGMMTIAILPRSLDTSRALQQGNPRS